MSAKECFGVIVRVVGLLVTLFAFVYLVSAAIVAINPHYRPDTAPVAHYLLTGLVGLAVGLFLLRGARYLVCFAYPDKDSEKAVNR